MVFSELNRCQHERTALALARDLCRGGKAGRPEPARQPLPQNGVPVTQLVGARLTQAFWRGFR